MRLTLSVAAIAALLVSVTTAAPIGPNGPCADV